MCVMCVPTTAPDMPAVLACCACLLCCHVCRQYEQESYGKLVKTIEGQDLLPQVGTTAPCCAMLRCAVLRHAVRLPRSMHMHRFVAAGHSPARARHCLYIPVA